MPTDICRWLFLLISLSTWITYTYSKDVRVVCYYTNWSVYRPGQAKFSPQNINPYLCTHLIYAFGGFTKENTLKPFDKYQDIEKGGYAKFTGLKTYNKNLKTMLAIGGWNEGSSRFSPMVASAERRKELVKNAVKFLRQNHFDGLDLDWEYPTFRDGGKARDRENYAHLVKELREEFERESEKTGRPRLLLTMAVPAGIEYINKGYDVPKLSKYLDWMNILSYDYHSAFEPAVNHHAPLYGLEEDSEYNYDADLNIDHTIKHYLELGADPNKLVLGIPTYGRSYTLFNPDAYEIGAPADGPGDMGEATRENGYLAYYEICDYVKSQDWEVVQPNEEAMGPYAFKGNQWVGYDDEEISRKKAQYVAKNNLGGIMFWAIDNDDFRGNCHGKPYPLIEAAKEALLEAYGITDDNLIAPTSKPVKQKTRTRTKVSSKDESDNQVSTSTTGRRRTRVKPKTSESSRDASTSKSKPRRRNKTEGTSTYSSLKVVTPSYTTPAPPATPEMGGAFKCEDEGFFPHPKDCKKYFWCLSGAGDSGIIAHQFTCPAGLYFNKAADSCDYTQNVLCNKKLSRTTPSDTKTSTSSSTTEKPTVSSLFSSTRVPPKITAATSKTTYSVRTTEATPEEEEYEEYEEDEEEDRKGDSEEDPRVIKELIDLIKKAGGIEELEKRLRSGETSSSGVDSTTPSILSKSLVARVLGQTGKNKITKANTFPFISKNSRGSQTEGIEKTDTVKKVDRGRPQYTSIARTRTSSAEKDEAEEKIDTETENKDNTKSNRNFKKTNTVEYVNIRRPKVSTTTESSDDDEFNRNKILGENDSDDEEDGEIKKTTPQYVNIRRLRPSTTPETATSKYKEIRRGSASNQVTEINEDEETSSKYNTIRRGTTPSSVDDDEDEGSVTSKYRSIRRGTTSAITTESAVQEDNTSTKYKTIQRGSTTAASSLADQSSPKYSSISRGTTSLSSSTTTDDERTRGTTRSSSTPESDNDLKYKTIQRGSTTSINNVDEPSTTRILSTATESTLSSIKSTLNSIRSESVGTTDAIIYTTFSNGDLDITTVPVSTEIPGVISTKLLPVTETSASTRRTPPTLLEPRPFSIRGQTKTRVESTTPTTKVSQSNFKLRLRSKTSDSQNGLSTESSLDSSTRGFSKFRNRDEDVEVKVKSRRFSTTTTEASARVTDEDNRTYRPSEIADLSSLTAIDLSIVKGLDGNNAFKRRGASRPRGSSTVGLPTTTEKQEALKTSGRTLAQARKPTFNKSRKVVVNDTEVEQSNDSVRVRPTSRKVIRRFRTTTANSLDDDDDVDEVTKSSFTRKRPSTTQNSQVRVRLSPKNSIQDILNKRPSRLPTLKFVEKDDQDDEEDENIKLSESNIRENSDVNNNDLVSNSKEFRKFQVFKGKIQGKSDINEKSLLVDEITTLDDELLTITTEASTTKKPFTPIIIRTRKIIRKIKPTEATTVGSTTVGGSSTTVDEHSTTVDGSGITETDSSATLNDTTVGGSTTTADSSNTVGNSSTTVEDSSTTAGNSTTAELNRRRKIIRRLRPISTTPISTDNKDNSTTDSPNKRRKFIIRGRPADSSFNATEAEHIFKGTNRFRLNATTKDDAEDTTIKTRGRFRPSTTTLENTSTESSDNSENVKITRGKFRPLAAVTSRFDEDEEEDEGERTTKTYKFVKTNEDTFRVKTYASRFPSKGKTDDDEDKLGINLSNRFNLLSTTSQPTTKESRLGIRTYASNYQSRSTTSTPLEEDDDAEYEDEEYDDEEEPKTTNKSISSRKPVFTVRRPSTTTERLIKDYRTKPRPSFRKSDTTSTTESPSSLLTTKTKYKFYTRTTASSVSTEATVKVSETTSESAPITTTEESVDTTVVTLANLILDSTTQDNNESSTLTDLTDDISTDISSIVDHLLIEANMTHKDNNTVVETTTAKETTTEGDTTTAKDTTTSKTTTVRDTTISSIQNKTETTTEEVTDLDTTSELSNTTTEEIETTKIETTTPYIRRSTLRSIDARPKFSPPRRTSNRPSVESSTVAQKRFRGRNPNADVVRRVPSVRARTSTTAIPVNKFIYNNNNRVKSKVVPKQEDDDSEEEYDEDEEYEDDDEQEPIVEKASTTQKPFSFTRSTTQRVINSPLAVRNNKNTAKNVPRASVASKPTKINKPTFHKTTEATVTEDLSDINTEKVKNRNKNLFSKKRTMNVPHVDVTITELPTTNTTEELVTLSPQVTKPSTIAETTESLTTLHHIFAQTDNDNETTTINPIQSATESFKSKVEKLIEVNRIIEVSAKEAKQQNHTVKEDKIGAINRVTVIKVVDGNNITQTIVENLSDNELNSRLPSSTETSKVNINIKGAYIIPELAVVKEISANDTSYLSDENIPPNHRKDRKYEIYGESKVLDYNGKSLPNEIIKSNGKATIIDGNSQVNIITPRPIYSTEASTISLERLFLTDTPRNLNALGNLLNLNNNEELLETQNSRFVNVRVLDQSGNRVNKGVRDDTDLVPIRILKQDDEEVTLKAHVVEVTPRSLQDTIKIVPIKVEMSRKLTENAPFSTRVESGVSKVNLKLLSP